MKRVIGLVLVGVVGTLAAASTAQAQGAFVFLGGGMTIPMSDFKEDAKAGWIATGGVGYNIGEKGLFVEAEGWYGSNKHKDGSGDKTNLLGATGAVGYMFNAAQKVSPYVLAGGGILAHQYKPAGGGASDTESKLAVTGAAGVGIDLNERISFWIEGRLLTTLDKDYKSMVVPVTAGISINFGGGGGN